MTQDNEPLGNAEWLKDLDLQDRVSCDNINCERPAIVYTRVKCCDSVIVTCRACMVDTITILNMKIRTGQPALCPVCGGFSDPRGWLTRPEPL